MCYGMEYKLLSHPTNQGVRSIKNQFPSRQSSSWLATQVKSVEEEFLISPGVGWV